MRPGWLASAALILVVQTGCAGLYQSRFVGAVAGAEVVDGRMRLADPDQRVVVIYNHGSNPEFVPDECYPTQQTPGGVPPVVAGLAGSEVKGRRILVYVLCTQERVGEFRHASQTGEPKVVKRAREITAVVRQFQEAGMPPGRIFLSGQSAGAWASLLVANERAVSISGVIGFAPAFAGHKATRQPGWQHIRDRQREVLRGAGRLHALIFAFDGDAYEPPDDLRFLGEIAGVTLIDLHPCESGAAHHTAFRRCFVTQRDRILRFMADRLP